MNLPDFSSARVLVVGDVMLDSYWHGATDRISPEAPVPVVRVEGEEARVGGAGNVALNAAALGAGTRLLGLAGEDEAAVRIEAILAAHAVQTRLQKVSGSRTITKLRILSRHQQLIRLDFEDLFPDWDARTLLADFRDMLGGVGAVVLSDYAKGALRGVAELIAAAGERGIPVVVDPKGVDFERYRGATLLTPNQAEFEAVAGHCASEAELVAKGEILRDRLALRALLVTRSERGMTLLEHGRPPLHLPTRAREVYDVTGAGDTVVGMLGAALAAGVGMAEAVALANLAAGVVVGKLGTATVSRVELQQELDRHAALQRGVVAEAELLQLVRRARAAGERIVMTNGCFDILHPGHVDYLERARALGDRLVVAVNDDASVRRLKGAKRPINPLAVRMRMLSALGAVDWVVPFSEDTPERLICGLGPDVLVKGGDYRPDEIAGAGCVRAAGGEVKVLEFLPGHSTSEIIEKIHQRG